MNAVMRRTAGLVLLAYLGAVLAATLYPFEFHEPRRLRDLRQAGAEWDSHDGMIFDTTGMFSFERGSPELRAAIADAGRFYVYFEAFPEGTGAPGPRRILSYEAGPARTAFSLNQQDDAMLFRVTGASGTSDFVFPRALVNHSWNSILLDVSADSIRLSRNGTTFGAYPFDGFDARKWHKASRWIAGNDTRGDLGWRGRLRVVELGIGPPPLETDAATRPLRTASTLFALSAPRSVYPRDWHAHKTDVLGRTARDPWSLVPFSEPASRTWARVDWVQNLLLFVPIGALLALRGWRAWQTGLAAFATSLFIETAQIFIPVRHTQTTDLVLNTAGALVGTAVTLALLRLVQGRVDARATL